jgi:hypothetical protein
MADRAAVGVACTGLKMVCDEGKESVLSEGIDIDDNGGMALNNRMGSAEISQKLTWDNSLCTK